MQEDEGLTELIEVSDLEIESTGHDISPLSTTTGQIGRNCNEDGEAFEGVLVKLEGVEIKSEPNWFNGEIDINDGSGKTVRERR